MKVSTNKNELKELNACEEGYKTFIKAHGDNNALLSECLDSNGWDDVWWLISGAYDEFTEKQKLDLRLFGCNRALVNIEKIKPYCSDDNYSLIVSYLNDPTESAMSAAMSAAWSAAWSAAMSAAWSAAESAARSAAMAEFTQELRDLFVSWECKGE